MDSISWGFIGTIVGVIVGASTSIATTIINANNSSRNQKRLEEYKRQEIFREFQRDNYLKLQETFFTANRLASLLYLEDLKNFKITGKWQETPLDPETDTNFMITLRDISIYLERIQNDNLREELKNLIRKMSSLSITSSKSQSKMIWLDIVTNDFEKAMTSIGVELRNNY